MSFYDILPSKNVTNVIIHRFTSSLSLETSLSMNKKVTSFKLIFRGKNVNKEDESFILPGLTFGTELDSKKEETDVRYGKNLVYTRRKTIPESTHTQEFVPILHEVNSNSSDSTSEFSHEQELESNSTPPPSPSHYQDLHLPTDLRKDTRNSTNNHFTLYQTT